MWVEGGGDHPWDERISRFAWYRHDSVPFPNYPYYRNYFRRNYNFLYKTMVGSGSDNISWFLIRIRRIRISFRNTDLQLVDAENSATYLFICTGTLGSQVSFVWTLGEIHAIKVSFFSFCRILSAEKLKLCFFYKNSRIKTFFFFHALKTESSIIISKSLNTCLESRNASVSILAKRKWGGGVLWVFGLRETCCLTSFVSEFLESGNFSLLPN